jgi:hypothetical protein
MATGRIGTTPVLTTRWSKAPAAGTTSLSGLDDNSVSLVYSVGYEAVYQNGVLLSRGNDYTATNGTTITLTTATVAGDIIEIFANQTIPLTDTYSQTVANSLFVNQATFDAKGDLIAGTADNAYSRLAVGANNTVLTADSSTATGLKWAAVSAGGMTLINTGGTTLSGATTTISSIPGTYEKLVLIIQNFRPAADTDLRIYFNADTNTRYKYVTGDTASFTFANSNILISGDSDADAASQGFSHTEIPNYANTTTWKTLFSYSFTNLYNLNTSGTCVVSYGVYNQTGAITSLTLKPGTGNFTSGTAYLYGVK